MISTILWILSVSSFFLVLCILAVRSDRKREIEDLTPREIRKWLIIDNPHLLRNRDFYETEQLVKLLQESPDIYTLDQCKKLIENHADKSVQDIRNLNEMLTLLNRLSK